MALKRKQGIIYGVAGVVAALGLWAGHLYKKGRDEARHAARLGWQEIQLPKDGSKAIFKVRLEKSHRQCFSGDLDAIEGELTYSKNPVALLSLEVIGDLNKPALVRKLTKDDFNKTLEHDFKIPSSYESLPLGVFICKDSSHTNRCQGDKKVVDIGEIIKIYYRGVNIDVDYAQPDKVYFFHHVMLSGSGLRLPNEGEKDMDYYQDVAKFYARFSSIDAAKEAVNAIERYNKIIRSVPASIGENYVKIDLPKRDPNCTPYIFVPDKKFKK